MRPHSSAPLAYLRRFAALIAGAALPALAPAQSYPEHAVTLVVSYPAGSVSDVLARNVAQQLGAQWKQPVVVDNKPGGNQIIAAGTVAKAPADGYTLLLCDDGVFTLNPHLFAKLPYAVTDFAPVAGLAELQMVLSVSKTVPANSLAELVTQSRAHPGALNYGSFGIGNITHLSMESFKKMAGADLVHVPYKGYPDAIRDVLANQIQAVMGGVGGPVLAHLKSGAMKPLAVTGSTRSTLLPNVPTFAEAGFPAFKPEVNFILVAPAGTPPAVIQKISLAAVAAVQNDLARSVLEPNGMKPLGRAPAELAKSLDASRSAYGEIVRATGVRLD